MQPEIKPQNTSRQDVQGDKMLEVPGHGEIKKEPYYTSLNVANIFKKSRYVVSQAISDIKLENPDNPDIVGEKIPGKHQEIAYNETGFLFLVDHYDQRIQNRGGRRTKTTKNK